MHLTNVAIQKTAPDYDPEKVHNSRTSNSSYQFTLLHGSAILSEMLKKIQSPLYVCIVGFFYL